MNNWFECKVKYEKLDSKSGKAKKVIEPYLIDALTFSEAEERIYKAVEELISGEFSVKGISKSNIGDVFEYESGERWFKCKLSYVDIDPESGKEKTVSNYNLVWADNARMAYDRLRERLKDMVIPFWIPSVVESPIVDIFPYDPNKTKPDNYRPVEESENYDRPYLRTSRLPQSPNDTIF